MKRLALAGVLALAACSSPTGVSPVRLVGAQDLVLVDELGEGGLLAKVELSSDGGTTTVGRPNQYLFVTSVDTNELRVLRMSRPDALGRQWVRAPNPLEPLSIPVIARPSMLAVDEGIHVDGRRVTGAYVYAGRPGASVLSVVSAAPEVFAAVTSRPIPLPSPLTAMAAWMGTGLSALPATTTLFVATFDGQRGALYAFELPTSPDALRAAVEGPTPEHPALRARLLFDVGAESIVALQVMPPLSGRTVDGQAFCDTVACLAIATRRGAGADGRTLLVDPQSLRAVPLDFGGPVRDFGTAGNGFRLFGILDEEKCGGPACGGIVGVDTLTAGSPAGFPRALDFTGQPMQPIRVGDALPMGLALAQGADLRQTYETLDGGVRQLGLVIVNYALLGIVSASNGQFTLFDGLAASPIDYDARRTTVSAATLFVPGLQVDGGISFVGEDGGFSGFAVRGTVDVEVPAVSDGGLGTEPWRIATIANPDGGAGTAFKLDVSDGYLASQTLVVVYQGQIPGLVNLPTSPADGTLLFVDGGFETRAAPGDLVSFLVNPGTEGGRLPAFECGTAKVRAIHPAGIEVDSVPAECSGPPTDGGIGGVRQLFSVRASGARPYVVAADLEGYIGRGAVGETLTYHRRYLARPPGWTGVRPALRVTLGDSIPPLRGAYWAFTIDGALQSYKLAFAAESLNCTAPQLPGRLLIAQLPTLTQTAGLTYPWEVVGVLPSGNAVFELPLASAFAGEVRQADGLLCR
jgi:hypothetical protein